MLLVILTIQYFYLYFFLFPFLNNLHKTDKSCWATSGATANGRNTTKEWTQQKPRFTWPIFARHDLHLLSTIFGVRAQGNFTLAAPQYTETGLMICNYIQPQREVPMIKVPSSSSDIQSIKRYFHANQIPFLLFCSKGEFSLPLQVSSFSVSPLIHTVHNFCVQSLLKHIKM